VARILPASIPEDLESYFQIHHEPFKHLHEYLSHTRLNINIRQVFADP
jgi:hypothetical protein